MLRSDERFTIDTGYIGDPRVKHFWDGDRVVGTWIAENIDGYEGISWDAFYLYGPDATWDALPEPLIASGSTVIGERETLERNIAPLLATP